MIIGKLIPAGTGMSRYRNIRVLTTGEPALSDDEARAMFGLPARTVEESDAEEAARHLFGGVGLQAVGGDGAVSGDGSEDGGFAGDGDGITAQEAAMSPVEDAEATEATTVAEAAEVPEEAAAE